MTSRRSFLLGLGAALAAPAIVRAESLMKIVPVRAMPDYGPIADYLDGIRYNANGQAQMANSSIWMVEWGRNAPIGLIRGADWTPRVITLTDADRKRLGLA